MKIGVLMMAKYTITIKTLIDNKFDFQMTNYPIFDENYRKTLNDNILHHYYENEIGFETAPLFRFYLNQKLNEIMPYYNELYKVQKKLIDDKLLLNNVNLTEERMLVFMRLVKSFILRQVKMFRLFNMKEH